MTRRVTLAVATFALLLSAGTAHAQRASIAVGAVMPTGDFANNAGTGLDVEFQARTEPLFGPVGLRIDIAYDHFAGKGGTVSGTTISTEAVSFIGNLSPMFYVAAGPGYYQSQIKTMILTHDVTEQQQFLGVQAAVGMNFPVFRWEGFIEVSAARLFSPGVSTMYVPLRFGVRL
jgi:hypothetical protein